MYEDYVLLDSLLVWWYTRCKENHMHQHSVYHTISIFEQLLRDIPPLVPASVIQDGKRMHEQIEHNYGLSLQDVDAILVAFGKQVWPQRKAFHEFYDIYEGTLGDQFLQSSLPGPLKKRYREFCTYGGDYRALYRGENVDFFTPEERQALCQHLVDVSTKVHAHTVQAVQSVDRYKYERRIAEFQDILTDIEERLQELRQMANDEHEHPELREELLAQVENFEHGLCLLDSHTQHHAVCSFKEHHEGRRYELKRRRNYTT